jgi:hypothetical protein
VLVFSDARGVARIEALNFAFGLLFVLITAVFVRRENLILCVAVPPVVPQNLIRAHGNAGEAGAALTRWTSNQESDAATVISRSS